MRSLGIVIYPDGSQAEIRLCKVDAPIWEEWVEFHPIKARRRLTLAPFGILLGLMLLVLSGCVHLQVKGDKPICLLDYNTGIKHCEYDSWQACHAAIQDQNICYHR